MRFKKLFLFVFFISFISLNSYPAGNKNVYLTVNLFNVNNGVIANDPTKAAETGDETEATEEEESEGEGTLSPTPDQRSKAVLSKQYAISDDFEISSANDSDFLIKSSQYEEYIPKKSLKSLGISIQMTSALELPTVNSNNKWAIYNLKGVLVKSGTVGEPDLSRLKAGNFYIVINGDKKYKYLHIR